MFIREELIIESYIKVQNEALVWYRGVVKRVGKQNVRGFEILSH